METPRPQFDIFKVQRVPQPQSHNRGNTLNYLSVTLKRCHVLQYLVMSSQRFRAFLTTYRRKSGAQRCDSFIKHQHFESGQVLPQNNIGVHSLIIREGFGVSGSVVIIIMYVVMMTSVIS